MDAFARGFVEVVNRAYRPTTNRPSIRLHIPPNIALFRLCLIMLHKIAKKDDTLLRYRIGEVRVEKTPRSSYTSDNPANNRADVYWRIDPSNTFVECSMGTELYIPGQPAVAFKCLLKDTKAVSNVLCWAAIFFLHMRSEPEARPPVDMFFQALRRKVSFGTRSRTSLTSSVSGNSSAPEDPNQIFPIIFRRANPPPGEEELSIWGLPYSGGKVKLQVGEVDSSAQYTFSFKNDDHPVAVYTYVFAFNSDSGIGMPFISFSYPPILTIFLPRRFGDGYYSWTQLDLLSRRFERRYGHSI